MKAALRKTEPPSLIEPYTLPLYEKQREAIFNPARYCVIEASTKAGKTHGCMVWLFEQALSGKVGDHYWWVAPIIAQAKIAFRRFLRGIKRGTFAINRTELTITLASGATIWFKGGDHPDSLYGDDVKAAVIDEGTRCKEEVFTAVRSTLTATRGRLRIIGNVKGRRNWAYHLARKAEGGEPAWHYAKLTAWDAVEGGVLAREEIEDAERTLPERVFAELYLAEPADDGGNPFGLSAIAACVGELSGCAPAVWGIDLAKSRDWTVCIALDSEGQVCCFERWQAPWRDTIRRVVHLTGTTPALVDSTGVGDPVLEELQAHGGHFDGFKFSASSKQQLMEGLALAIQRRAVVFPDGVIRAELDAFEYTYRRHGVTYEAPEGMHDDCVCALALAVQHAKAPQPVRREFVIR